MLISADILLQAAQRKTAKILLALNRGRFYEAPEMMGDLMKELHAARAILRDYYDQPDNGDDENGT